MKRLLLFDVDGTLVDVAGAGRDALRASMRRVYGETGPVETFDFRGQTDPAIVRGLLAAAGLEEAEVEARLPELWTVYPCELARALDARAEAVGPQPGVPELLERLSSDPRFALALVTGNVREGARRKLAACGLGGLFATGGFGSDSARREDLPPLAVRRARRRFGRTFRGEDVWVIGDTPDDVRCGRHCGHRTLAVTTGGFGADELRRHGADRVVSTLERCDDLVGSLAA